MEYKFGLEKYSLNVLKNMEIIDINSGTRLGHIRDFIIDCDNFKIKSFLIPANKPSWFTKESVYEISWDRIQKIGVDVILIDGTELINHQ